MPCCSASSLCTRSASFGVARLAAVKAYSEVGAFPHRLCLKCPLAKDSAFEDTPSKCVYRSLADERFGTNLRLLQRVSTSGKASETLEKTFEQLLALQPVTTWSTS